MFEPNGYHGTEFNANQTTSTRGRLQHPKVMTVNRFLGEDHPLILTY
jgi:hypothetical protein